MLRVKFENQDDIVRVMRALVEDDIYFKYTGYNCVQKKETLEVDLDMEDIEDICLENSVDFDAVERDY